MILRVATYVFSQAYIYYLEFFWHFQLCDISKIETTYFNSIKHGLRNFITQEPRLFRAQRAQFFHITNESFIRNPSQFTRFYYATRTKGIRHSSQLPAFEWRRNEEFPRRRAKRPRDNIRLFEPPTNEESSFSQNEGPPREKYEKSERRTLFFFSLLKKRSFLSPRSGIRIEWTYSPSGDHFFSDTNYTVEQSTLFLSVPSIL